MWYKKTYYDDAEGADENLRMCEAFEQFYAEEKSKNPNDAKGLAMFGGRIHYFHTACLFHDAHFFSKHKCSLTSQPSPIPEFLAGEREFAESLSKKI